MKPEFLHRVEELYFSLRELDRAAQDAALDKHCLGDDSLRAEVRRLIDHAGRVGGFLQQPAAFASLPAQLERLEEEDLSGQCVGPYRLVRTVGTGGMGTVYLADRADGAFEQRVAVKLIKRGMDSDEILRRFRAERQVLAGLNHPYVARLLDGGVTPAGRSFLVMEYADGIPIDRYCDARRLSTHERLRLFRRVCEAVHSAHQNLVVHRDLKPNNILVTSAGAPKLVDFGIAKFFGSDATGTHTALSERRLTPEYASPEQITGGPITTATDVYSLGVVLYELLSGQRPYEFKTRSTGEIERVVCHVLPPPPSAAVTRPSGRGAATGKPESAEPGHTDAPSGLRRQLRGDLDQIVMMALRKEPHSRYASVERLMEDIDRYLGGLPVVARKGALLYRAGKFIRRHLVATCVSAAMAGTLFGGVALVWRESLIAAGERDAAYLARDQAEAIAEFLRQALAAADPDVAGPDLTVRALVDEAAVRVTADLKDRPLVQAAVRSTLGRAYLALGLYDRAETELSAAFGTRLERLGPDHHDVAESKMDTAALLYALGRFDEAVGLLREALAAHVRLRGEQNLDTARVWNDLGAALRGAGRLDEAEQAHRRAMEMRRSLAGSESPVVAESLNNLAIVLGTRGDAQGALAMMVEATRIRERALGRDHPLVVQSIQNTAVSLSRIGDPTAAQELLRDALGRCEAAYGRGHPNTARVLRNLGLTHFGRLEFAAAEPLLREACEIEQGRYPPDNLRLATTRMLWARALARLGRSADAERELLAALNVAREKGPLTGAWADALRDLITLFERNGHPQQAESWRALQIAPPD